MANLLQARVHTLAELEAFCRNARTKLTALGEDETDIRNSCPDMTGEVVHVMNSRRLNLVRRTLNDGQRVFDIVITA